MALHDGNRVVGGGANRGQTDIGDRIAECLRANHQDASAGRMAVREHGGRRLR